MDNFLEAEAVWLGVTTIALHAVKDGFKIGLGEGRMFSGGEELIGER